jgi:hypothetical protein
VMYGWRCVYCMPPLGVMEEARSIVEECGAVREEMKRQGLVPL